VAEEFVVGHGAASGPRAGTEMILDPAAGQVQPKRDSNSA